MMTDKTKAIPRGWIAPYYDRIGERDADCDILVDTNDDDYLPIILNDFGMGTKSEIPLDQAKALIHALQMAIIEVEGAK